MKRYIRAAETSDDFKVMLTQYKHRRDFYNADDAELADFLDELNNKSVAHDVYQHKTGGGCTVFYDDIPGSASCTVAAAAGDNWGRVKKLLESEFDRGVPDPIFDAGAKVGKKVLPLMDAVQKQLNVDFSGEFYDGDGIVEFVTVGEDPVLVTDSIDFKTFYRKLIGMIMEANSVEDFKQRYRTYVSDLIDEYGYDADEDVTSATVVDSELISKGPAWIVRYNYDTGSRESGPHPEWDELLIYAPNEEMAEAKFEKDHLDDIPGHYDGCFVRKATETEIRQWESAWAEDDPADLTSSTKINAATTQRMTDFQLEHLLELADDILYQVHENYRYDDYTKKDIIQMVIEHVIMVITEMDDDGVYKELMPFASTKNRQFMKNLNEHVGEMYDTLEWQY